MPHERVFGVLKNRVNFVDDVKAELGDRYSNPMKAFFLHRFSAKVCDEILKLTPITLKGIESSMFAKLRMFLLKNNI
jgi:hypothetical protein